MNVHGLQWVGWSLFSVSAVGFIIAAAQAGDPIALFGAIAFMAANAVFMLAHHRIAVEGSASDATPESLYDEGADQ